MAKRKSLGRGLDALLKPAGSSASPSQDSDSPSQAPAEAVRSDPGFRELPIELLARGRYQPRIDMREEGLRELADSIAAQGIVQPIVVRPLARGPSDTEQRYEIVAGERRWRAAQLAGLDRVPTVIRDVDDRTALAVALIENMQREDLNPIEEAGSLRRLIDEFEMTHAEAAEAVGRSRAAVSNLLRLLELPATVRKLVEDRQLNMGHGRALLGADTRELIDELAAKAVKLGWSVRETEEAVRRAHGVAPRPSSAARQKPKDPDVARLEADLSDRLGASVALDHGPKGGRIVIRYHSLDELDGIIERIK